LGAHSCHGYGGAQNRQTHSARARKGAGQREQETGQNCGDQEIRQFKENKVRDQNASRKCERRHEERLTPHTDVVLGLV
jgi:hypothetical protein